VMRFFLQLVFIPLVGLMSTAWVIFVAVIFLSVVGPNLSVSDTIEEGSAYGVTIGTSKDQVYSDLIKSFSIRDLYVVEPKIPESPPDLRIIGEGVYERLMKEDNWRIRPFSQWLESYNFTFKNSKLIKIHHSWAVIGAF